ncbi:hypothetical protein C8Q74DRAFT_1216050 [Fomes fomentarius]|nr:hypothetical protein C8Q74DRAFT_1216050 [Fomes fomentarius]
MVRLDLDAGLNTTPMRAWVVGMDLHDLDHPSMTLITPQQTGNDERKPRSRPRIPVWAWVIDMDLCSMSSRQQHLDHPSMSLTNGQRTGNNDRNTAYKVTDTHAGMGYRDGLGASHAAARVNLASRPGAVHDQCRLQTTHGPCRDIQRPEVVLDCRSGLGDCDHEQRTTTPEYAHVQVSLSYVGTYLDLKDMIRPYATTYGSDLILGAWTTSRDSDDIVLACHGLDDLPIAIFGSSGY